jgi:hypothetical protein
MKWGGASHVLFSLGNHSRCSVVRCCELQFQTQMEEIMKYDGNIRQPLLKPLLGVNHARTMSGISLEIVA